MGFLSLATVKHRPKSDNFQQNEPDRLRGERGRVNPPPCGPVLRFGRFGGSGDWFGGSTRLEARASADFMKARPLNVKERDSGIPIPEILRLRDSELPS